MSAPPCYDPREETLRDFVMPIRSPIVAAMLFAAVPAALAATLVPWKGGKTPVLELADVNGRVHSLSEWRGKTVVVNFWATWCEPCRDEMPSLERLRARLGSRAFEVVAVNVGESPERVQRFTRETPLSFPILLDRERETARSWQVRGYPTSYVVGPDGRIRYYFVGDLDWASDEIVRVIEKVK
jgi:thiol-disulfide isomerase/thioredoxin